MYLVDSSVWIALFLDDDTQHAKAVEAMDSIGDAHIQIPYGVISETVTVLSRKQSKELADKFIEYIRNNPQIHTTSSFVSEDMRIFLAEKDRLAFVDAILKNLALSNGLVLVSFDKQLLNSLKKTGRVAH